MEEPQGDRQAARQELVRRANERWNAGDREVRGKRSIPSAIRSALTGSVHRGYDRARTWMQEIDEQFESRRTRLDEFVQSAGNGCSYLDRSASAGGRVESNSRFRSPGCSSSAATGFCG
jgi:hypothetical protein